MNIENFQTHPFTLDVATTITPLPPLKLEPDNFSMVMMIALLEVTMTWMMTCNKLSLLKDRFLKLFHLRYVCNAPYTSEIHHCSTETFLAGPSSLWCIHSD